MEHDLYLISNDFWNKRKMDNFDPYSVFLVIATNTPQRLMTGFVLQGHIYIINIHSTHTYYVNFFYFGCN